MRSRVQGKRGRSKLEEAKCHDAHVVVCEGQEDAVLEVAFILLSVCPLSRLISSSQLGCRSRLHGIWSWHYLNGRTSAAAGSWQHNDTDSAEGEGFFRKKPQRLHDGIRD